MNAQVYILALLAACLLGLAMWIISRYQSSPSILYYAGFLFGLATIAATQAALSVDLPVDQATLLTRLGYLGGVWTFSMLLMFSWYYPVPNRHLPKQANLLWIVPIVFFVPFALSSSSFIQYAQTTTSGLLEHHGQLFLVFPLFVLAYVIAALRNLIAKLGYVRVKQRNDTQTFIWVLIVATLAGLIFDVLLPATGRMRIPIGIYSSAVLFGLSTYIVAKR